MQHLSSSIMLLCYVAVVNTEHNMGIISESPINTQLASDMVIKTNMEYG